MTGSALDTPSILTGNAAQNPQLSPSPIATMMTRLKKMTTTTRTTLLIAFLPSHLELNRLNILPSLWRLLGSWPKDWMPLAKAAPAPKSLTLHGSILLQWQYITIVHQFFYPFSIVHILHKHQKYTSCANHANEIFDSNKVLCIWGKKLSSGTLTDSNQQSQIIICLQVTLNLYYTNTARHRCVVPFIVESSRFLELFRPPL